MLTLSDGTPIQMQEEAYDTLLGWLEDAFDDNDQEVLVEIHGYKSKSTGSVSNITLNIVFDYRQLLVEALAHVEGYSVSSPDTAIADKSTWKKAKQEIISSLQKSINGNNERNYTSRASEAVLPDLHSVRVGYTSGNLQLQGVVEHYELVEEGEENTRKSRAKTLAKEEIYEGTFRDSDAVGAFKTLSLERDRFDKLVVAGQELSSEGFYSDVQDNAIRVFSGDRGFSERVVLAEAGSQVVLELAETFGKYEIVAEHSHAGTTRKVSAIRSELGNTGDSIAMAEISASKNLRSDTLVATLSNGTLVVQEIEATSKNSHRVGPSPSSETFVEVKRESKKMKDGEKLIFIRPVSEQVKVNLKWDNQQDLDLNCFVELNSGRRVILQPLGRQFGALETSPFVLHSGDDRLGSSDDGEFIFAEMSNLQHIKRIVFYATIYSGASNWSQTDAVVTIYVPGHGEIVVPLNEQNSENRQNKCALCTVGIDGRQLSVERHVTFHKSNLFEHTDGRTVDEMDVQYDFGMNWHYASKD